MQENLYEEGRDVSVTVGGALDHCDVACLLYDSSNSTSFQVATAMMVRALSHNRSIGDLSAWGRGGGGYNHKSLTSENAKFRKT